MAAKKPLRIALTGPESTGKSILCRQLADYFNEPWVPEYSREYLANLDDVYNFNDILMIARGQFEKEQKLLKYAGEYLFCDTDFTVTHVWSMVKYGKSHKWIEEMAIKHPYDMTLLCNIDLPWEYDPLRENPDNRDYLFNLYLVELQNRRAPFSIVSGKNDNRFYNALEILSNHGIHAGG